MSVQASSCGLTHFGISAGVKLRPDTYKTLLYLCSGGDNWQSRFKDLPIPWPERERTADARGCAPNGNAATQQHAEHSGRKVCFSSSFLTCVLLNLWYHYAGSSPRSKCILPRCLAGLLTDTYFSVC